MQTNNKKCLIIAPREKSKSGIFVAVNQSENESHSRNIISVTKQQAAQGTSKLFDRKYYGYYNDDDGTTATGSQVANWQGYMAKKNNA